MGLRSEGRIMSSLYRDGWNECLHRVRQAVFVKTGSLTLEQNEALQAFSESLKDFEVDDDGKCPMCEDEKPLVCPRCLGTLKKEPENG